MSDSLESKQKQANIIAELAGPLHAGNIVDNWRIHLRENHVHDDKPYALVFEVIVPITALDMHRLSDA